MADAAVPDSVHPTAETPVAHRPQLAYTPRPFTARRSAAEKAVLRRDALKHAEYRREGRIRVAAALDAPHPRVAATRAALDAATPGELGMVESAGPEGLRVRVTRELATRALLILDALVRACEGRGWAVGYEAEPVPRNTVVLDGEVVGFVLYEIVDRTPHVPTKAELRRQRDDPIFYQIARTDHAASGRLYLGVSPCHHGRGHWSDTSRWAIEDALDYCVETIAETAKQLPALRVAEAERERQREAEEQARREAEAGRREKERQGKLAEELDGRRRRALAKALERMSEADAARAYADRLEMSLSNTPHAADHEACVTWVAWVRQHADLLDPCTPQHVPPDVR